MSLKLVLIFLSFVLTLQGQYEDTLEIQDILNASPQVTPSPLRVVLMPLHRTIYKPEVQVIAPVVQLNVREGDSFKKGELILQLDPGKYQAFYDKAKADAEKAEVELRAKHKLFQDETISLFDFMQAKASLATARAEVEIAKKNLEATTIIAPYDGKVANLFIELHELPVEGREMIELIEDTHLRGIILVPSSLVSKIQIGDKVDIFIEEKQDTYEAKISSIAATIDPASSTLKIEVDVNNENNELKAGMSGSAELSEKQSEKSNL